MPRTPDVTPWFGLKLPTLEPGSYTGLVNEEPVQFVNSVVGLGTNKFMSEEDAYNITKAIFENGEALVGAAAWMDVIAPERGLDFKGKPPRIATRKNPFVSTVCRSRAEN